MLRDVIGFLALSGVVALAGCGGQSSSAQTETAPPNETPLPPSKLHALYSTPHREDGVVLNGGHAGRHWIKWIGPDGSIRLSAAHGMFTDKGTVHVEDDKVCSKWQHIDDGKMACMRVAPVGKNTYVSLKGDGTPVSRFDVTIPGAPPDLWQ